jgi:nucleoside-diphosphate-sugar epimerase
MIESINTKKLSWFLSDNSNLVKVPSLEVGFSVVIVGASSTLGSSLAFYFLQYRKVSGLAFKIYLISRAQSLARFIQFSNDFILIEFGSISNLGPSICFFCASPASPTAYLANPIDTLEANSKLPLNILGLLDSTSTFVYFSTTGVYDRVADQYPSEDSKLVSLDFSNHSSVYICSKIVGEFLSVSYCKAKGLNPVVIRPSITITPFAADDDNRLHSEVLRSILNGTPIQVNSISNPKRNFLFVLDFIDALILILSQELQQITYNITNPLSTSIMDYLSLVSTESLSGSRLRYFQHSNARLSGKDFSDTVVKNTRLDAIGWSPRWDLISAYEKILRFYDR